MLGKAIVEAIHGSGQNSGRLFNQRSLKVTKLQEFENDFFTVKEKVQDTTNLFPEDLVIRDECEIARALCRTLTVHAQNMGIHIDLLNN
jgi:hypothetical protein